jgi:hypothetical protein
MLLELSLSTPVLVLFLGGCPVRHKEPAPERSALGGEGKKKVSLEVDFDFLIQPAVLILGSLPSN